MDINKQWQKLEQANFNQTIQKEEIMKAIKLESTSTISELKKRLGQKINWTKLFIALFVFIAVFFYKNTDIISIMALATVTYFAGYIVLKQEHNKIVSLEETSGSILEGLKGNLAAIKSALNKERIFGLIALPIMMIVGISLSAFKKGETWAEIFATKFSLLNLLVFVVLILLIAWGAEKMNKVAFGEHISKLEDQIKEFEKVS